MINFINNLFKVHLKKYEAELALHYELPEQLQVDTLANLLVTMEGTAFGQDHHLAGVRHGAGFAERVPVRNYDELQPYLRRMLRGEDNVLSPDRVRWLAQTAGTTSGQSKYVPVTRDNIQECHVKGSWMTLAMLHMQREDLKIFARKNLLIGGGVYDPHPDNGFPVADISAILVHSIPLVVRPFYIPDVKTATLPNYERKVRIIAEMAAREDSITMLGGVPTWNLALYRHILEITGASNLLEVWPNLQAYIHGGVSFGPYRETFRRLIPKPDFLYQEVYNASEGYFALQDGEERDDMLLLLTNGIYYEFIPFEQFRSGDRTAIPLSEVEEDVPYALVITTNAGLYRYLVGDLITFTTRSPYRIKIVGRTQEFINAFGEDLLSENVENALVKACRETGAVVKDYTIAPYYLSERERGRHQWFIEFLELPVEQSVFTRSLDLALQRENSNYAQKRSNDFAISELEVIALPPGFFQQWLRRKGKVGGQSKVPKLANHRHFADEILAEINTMIGES
ncbi:MAG: GH3 auxin-responsive promoter family protein [Lewinella sp.]|nr:GH3 auxin-responsive promoter family protein [Lewinella sp.]